MPHRIHRLALGWIGTLALLVAASSEGQGAVRYQIDATFEPLRSRLDAVARVFFDREDCSGGPLSFHLHGELSVEAIEAGGTPVRFQSEKVFFDHDYSLVATQVAVPCPTGGLAGGLEVRYSGAFHPSAARSPSDYMRIDEDGVFLRAYGYSAWFPIFLASGADSHPVDFERVRLVIPTEFRAVFVGSRSWDRVEGGARVSVWSAPATDLFDAQVTAARFVERSEGALRIFHRSGVESAAGAERIAASAASLVAFYRSHYRPVGEDLDTLLVEMPAFGNIASGNMVGIASGDWSGFAPESPSGRLLAHELVHAFVQPRILRQDPAYALVIEGFPSYFHLPALAEILGEGWYREALDRVESSYRSRRETKIDRRGRPLPPEKPLYEIGPEEIGIYKDRFVLSDRALLFLDALRSQLGPADFLAFSRTLLDRDSLTSAALEAVIQQAAPAFDSRRWLRTTEWEPGG